MMVNRCSRCGAEGLTDRIQGLCPACLFHETGAGQDWEPLEIGESFGSLEILSRVGRGGMGIVYRARQPHLERDVALKVLSPALAADPEFRERFLLEAKVLAKFDHPHIVSIYDFGERDGLYFLVMEFVEGVNLRQLLVGSELASEELLKLVPQLCEALEYAHSQGVVHRDIKPENIMVDRKGRIKITDFGIAKLAEAGKKITQAGVAVGTKEYMAPEQRDAPERVDHRADLYSLGVVIYEILTGKVPASEYVRPSRIARTDPRMDRIVKRLLEREPEKRYETARELHEAVTQVVTQPPRRSKATWLWLAPLALLAVLGAFFLKREKPHFQERSRVDELLELLKSESIEAREKAAAELTELASRDPQVEARIMTELGHAQDPEVKARLEQILGELDFVRAKRVKLVDAWRIEGQGGTPSALALSPDGRIIASWGPDRRIVLSSTDDLREVGVVATTDKDVDLLAFSPDGASLAAAEGKIVVIRELRTGKVSARLDNGNEVMAILYSKDGSKLFVNASEGLAVWNPSTGELGRTEKAGLVNALALTPDGTTLIAQLDDQALVGWRLSDWQRCFSVDGDEFYSDHTPGSIAIDPSGRFVAQRRVVVPMEWKCETVLWEIETGKAARREPASGHAQAVVGGRDNYVVLSSRGNTIRSWNDAAFHLSSEEMASGTVLIGDDALFVASGGQLRKVSMKPSLRLDRWARPHRGRIHRAVFHPDGTSLFTIGEDRMFRIWDTAGGKETGAFESGVEEPDEMAISPDGKRLVMSGERGELTIYDLAERRPIGKLPGNRVPAVGLGFTPDGKILIGQHNGLVRVLDKGSVESTFGEAGHYVFRLRFSSDGRFAVRSDPNEGIDFWEIASGKRHWAIQARDAGVVAFSPDGKRIYYSRGKDLIAVDVRSQAAIRTIGLEDEPVYCGIVPDPTGRFLALVLRSNTLVLLHAGTLREVLRRPIPDLWDVRFGPDGKKLALECETSVSMMELRAE